MGFGEVCGVNFVIGRLENMRLLFICYEMLSCWKAYTFHMMLVFGVHNWKLYFSHPDRGCVFQDGNYAM